MDPLQNRPANMSRDFWMPDGSCSVCYECESQFTVFNRRHHCRLCGRIFCGKCTTNSVRALSDEPKSEAEDGDTVRVCNYCFEQQKQGSAALNPGLSSSPSSSSLVSNQSSNEEGDDYFHRSQSEATPLSSDICSDTVNYVNIDHIYEQHVVHPSEEKTCSTYDSMLSPENCETHQLDYVRKVEDEANVSNVEAVDYENNDLLWLPPEPEDEEDEKESPFPEDDDDNLDDTTEKLGYLRSSSFDVGGSRIRDRSIKEHRTSMKRVVDEHFRALITQLLQAENLMTIEDDVEESWLDIITMLSWEAANLLKPDKSMGEGMDPGEYVKVKYIACGYRNQSMVVKGVVCKKNVAHRRMTSNINKARLLLVGGALEYQRVANHMSSFNTLLQQEMDHLKMDVAKIDAHHPNILLVEKSAPGYAQDYLLAKDISLVLNVKRPLLEHIARCTGAQIVPSIDNISPTNVGYCDSFHVEKFLEDPVSAGQDGKKLTKTLMFFEGCPRPLGCTILLKGASGDELKKVKHVVRYGVFAAYHLALQTSFLAEEGASLPEFALMSPIKVTLPDRPSGIDMSITMIPGYNVLSSEKPKPSVNPFHLTTDLFLDIRESSRIPIFKDNNSKFSGQCCVAKKLDYIDEVEGNDTLGTSHVCKFEASGQGISPSHADGNELPSNLDSSEELGPFKEEFPPSPSDQQSILVSLSTRCVWKGNVCERPHLFRIKYYGNFDKPLGRFLRDQLFDQGYRCQSCELPSEAHIHCYTNQQGSLTISVKQLQGFLLAGEREGKIWMWRRCLRCPRINNFPPATKRVLMSGAVWGLSFGKFLELSFSNHAATTRLATCGHSIHRDCLRFYGFGRTVACFRYAPITVHSVCLPPSEIEFNFYEQEWIQEDLNEVRSKATLLFTEVSEVIHQIYIKIAKQTRTNAPESSRQLEGLELMFQTEKKEFEESMCHVLNMEVKSGKPAVNILEMNRLRRKLVFLAYVWDQRLIHIARSTVPNVCSSTKQDPGPCHSSGLTSNNHSDRQVKTVRRRALSEGHFPAMENLSDLDAEWAENQWPTNIALKGEAIFTSPHALNQDLSASVSTIVAKEIDLPKFDPNGMENTSSWVRIPFSFLYGSFNKISSEIKLAMISNYNPVHISSLRELVHLGGARLLLPVASNDITLPVYDDEPTSIISYALTSSVYHNFMSENQKELLSSTSLSNLESVYLRSLNSFEDAPTESLRSVRSADQSVLSTRSWSFSGLDQLLFSNSLHARVSFSDGKVKYSVTCYFAKQFEALRRICCPSELDFILSLSRGKKWGAQGGKSNAFFAKTLDDRFIVKQVTKTELESFVKFAPSYFKYVSESISTGCPTCLAKILGIYQVTIKHLKGGKETRMDVLVMENLLFRRNITRLYDLKGSTRSRYNPDSTGSNKVMLDQNLIEAMPTSPIFLGTKAKRLLERAVWNDTAFLASIYVMDYSLIVGVDEEKHELVLGIIDFVRQYTWDKHLETWVKASGILGGPKNTPPTVISPKNYKKRFRKAMSAYFLMVPDEWSSSLIFPND